MGRSKSNGFVLAATEETHNGHGPVKKTPPQTQEVTVDKIELGTLRRSITLVGAVAILIANIGGIGIFITPTMILRFSGSPGLSILIWLLGGIVQAAYAFCTVEIALMFNKAGGPYFYIYSSFGDMAGFVYMWGFVIFIVGPSWALGSYTASLYTLSVIFTDCQPSDFLVKLVALWLMVTLMALNSTYMKVITSIQSILTSCKVIALAIIIVSGLIYVPTETGQENLGSFMDESTTNIGNIALGLFAGSYGFGGWQVITVLAEEVKDPVRNIPRSLGFTFAVLIVVMVATNFAYYVVLSKSEALKSEAVAMLFGQRIHPVIPLIMSVLVSLCAIGNLNVLIMGQPRVLFAAGRNGHMPRIMTMLHKTYHTPWPATWTLGVVASYLLLTGSVMSLVAAISLYFGASAILLTVSIFVLRWKHPDKHRPFRIPTAVPIVVFVIMTVILFMSIYEKPWTLVSNLITILLGIPIYVIVFKCERVKKHLNFMSRIGYYLEKAFLLQYES
ncbi:hypothetical protein RRG08_065664 [Elysia crispata]|uniref:Amino acid permease n=1 Tax=Elysia crispata TaxID=231223 RepID=A0AAE1DET7_9GAST|nr:hypothetical protein RRG08_065664 [Elysia crispata]